jgi:hypothetical protein
MAWITTPGTIASAESKTTPEIRSVLIWAVVGGASSAATINNAAMDCRDLQEFIRFSFRFSRYRPSAAAARAAILSYGVVN